jgi:hypothetical protein
MSKSQVTIYDTLSFFLFQGKKGFPKISLFFSRTLHPASVLPSTSPVTSRKIKVSKYGANCLGLIDSLLM